MKINEIESLNLEETFFKLSDNSITAKVNGKTKAVINDIQSVKSLPFNRKAKIHMEFKGKLNRYFDSLYISHDNVLYYIIDKKYMKLCEDGVKYGYTEEYNKLQNKIKELNELNINIIYLNVA